MHPTPRLSLQSVYKQTLSVLDKLPKDYEYRQSTETFTRQRLGLVADEQKSLEQVASDLGVMRIEQVLMQAEDELKLAEQVLEWRAWEPLEEAAPEGQWKYFNQQEQKS